MNWDINNIPAMIEIVNNEILNGTTSLTKIAIEVFQKNESTLRDAFKKAGYRRTDKKGIYIFDEELYNSMAITKKPKNKVNSTSIMNDIHKKDSGSITNAIQVAPKDLNTGIMTDADVIALKELVSLVEPIKAVIKEYNTRIADDNVIDIEPIELKLDDKIGVVGKPVGMRIDENVYKEWQEFTNKHKKNFKSHQLLSQALLEFMKKYK